MQRFLAQGNDAVKKQNYEEAVRFYEGALELDSCFTDAWNNLGTLYYNQQNFTQAVEHYTRAISCNPQYADGYLNRANTYYELNELFSALKDLERLEQLRPDTLPLHFSRGLVYTKMQNYEKAKASFREAIRIDESNDELLINLGTVYYYEKQYDSARLFLEKVIDRNKNHADAYNVLALIEAESGNVSKGFEFVSQAVKLKPKNAYYLNNRGYLHLLENKTEEALADIDASIGIDPYNGFAYRNV